MSDPADRHRIVPYGTPGPRRGSRLAMIRINLMGGQFQTLRANLHIRIFQTTERMGLLQASPGVEEGVAQRRRLTLLSLGWSAGKILTVPGF
eukprot:453742-Hanusia_phi.AAC.1